MTEKPAHWWAQIDVTPFHNDFAAFDSLAKLYLLEDSTVTFNSFLACTAGLTPVFIAEKTSFWIADVFFSLNSFPFLHFLAILFWHFFANREEFRKSLFKNKEQWIS